jgi:hypothetical protein
MQHSIITIGIRYQELSEMRNDDPKFVAKDFFDFAKKNKDKYSIFDCGHDLYVSTWHSDELINDYKRSLKN